MTVRRPPVPVGGALSLLGPSTEGTAEPDVGRTGRVTCGFGTSPATDRVEATVAASEGRGARSERLTVAGAPAVLFSAPEDTTLVATVEART